MSTVNKTFSDKLLAEGESNTISHKRLVSLASLATLIALAVMSAFGMCASTEFIWVFGVLTGGESVLTVIEKAKKLTSNSSYLSKVSEEESGAAD